MVNTSLKFGYTLLTNEILAFVMTHGLDPHIGFLRGFVCGRPSLEKITSANTELKQHGCCFSP